MKFHILTLFPEMVTGGLSGSIVGRAVREGRIGIGMVDIREFSTDRHKRVDDYTYGGGAGMLMQAQPVYDAWKAAVSACLPREDTPGRQSGDDMQEAEGQQRGKVRTIYVTPQGRKFTQEFARQLSQEDDVIILCGHYEGIDERVLEETVTDYVSIGDYVLTGGELAAMVIVDAVARLVPGVLHNDDSAETESFQGYLLEYPQYSRPEEWRGRKVPPVLLSGDQRKISQWRLEQAVRRTRQRRPDLWKEYERLQACREILSERKLLHMDMIELISRGRAKLLYWEGREILLADIRSGICFHSMDGEDGPRGISGDPPHTIVCHQRAAAEAFCGRFGMKQTAECIQAVWTRREKLPVRGLYRPDGKPMDSGSTEGLVIRPLSPDHDRLVKDNTDPYLSLDYIRKRIAEGAMLGAFVGEDPAGFIGFHEEGSIGMLAVLPRYRHRHVAKALETCIMNCAIDNGWTPYGQIIAGNEGSLALQQSLGLCLAKEPVFWTENYSKCIK